MGGFCLPDPKKDKFCRKKAKIRFKSNAMIRKIQRFQKNELRCSACASPNNSVLIELSIRVRTLIFRLSIQYIWIYFLNLAFFVPQQHQATP